MTTMALQEREGVELLNKAIAELERVLKENGGAKNKLSSANIRCMRDYRPIPNRLILFLYKFKTAS